MQRAALGSSGPLIDVSVGSEIGVSDWLMITQDMIRSFGKATMDSDPMHDDPDWAKAHGPYNGTIAYGFQTIGLLAFLMRGATDGHGGMTPNGAGHPLNYGFDRLRLVTPVPVDSRIRGRFKMTGRTVDEKNRLVHRVEAVVEIEGQDRPALVAEWLFAWVPAALS